MTHVRETTSEALHKKKLRSGFLIRKHFVGSLCLFRNSIEAESLQIESADYCFVISLVALVKVQPLSFELDINELLRVILNGMQDLNAFPKLMPERTNILWGRPGKTNQPDKLKLIRNWACLQRVQYPLLRCKKRKLSAQRPLLGLLLTVQYRERRRLWCPVRQSWTQNWHNVVFSNESRFSVQYSDDRICVWSLRGEF